VKTAGKSLRAWWHRHQRLRRRWTACRWSHAFEAAEPRVLRRTAETGRPAPAFKSRRECHFLARSSGTSTGSVLALQLDANSESTTARCVEANLHVPVCRKAAPVRHVRIVPAQRSGHSRCVCQASPRMAANASHSLYGKSARAGVQEGCAGAPRPDRSGTALRTFKVACVRPRPGWQPMPLTAYIACASCAGMAYRVTMVGTMTELNSVVGRYSLDGFLADFSLQRSPLYQRLWALSRCAHSRQQQGAYFAESRAFTGQAR